MSRYKQADRENQMLKIRKRLLQAAAAEFADQGYERANVDSISMAAGYAKGTIYNYFANKRALMLELLDEIAAHHVTLVAGQVRQLDDPAGRLRRFFGAGLAWASGYPDRARVINAVLHGADAEFKTRADGGCQPLLELLNSEILAAGMLQGVFRPVDPSSTAGLLMVLYLGAVSQLDEQGKPRLSLAQVKDFALAAISSNPTPTAKES